MEPTQILIVLTAICVCALLAHKLRVAPPIAFLLGGLGLALMPNMPQVSINPDYMLLIFLPPILMEAAFFTSLRDFRANMRPILLLAIGLVIMTSVGVAGVMVGLMPGVSWSLGFVLGAIVSPPDAAAATAALRGVRVPKRVTSILEGESLVNDATGIVLYKFAVAAVMMGSFSITEASTEFLWKCSGGLVIGLAVAYVFIRTFRYLLDPSLEILATLLPAFAAYILAEMVHASGILAVVSAGMMIGWHAPTLFNPRMRISMDAIWHTGVFFLNSVAFMLIGLQLPALLDRLNIDDHPMLLALALAVCVTCVAIRFIWVFLMSYGLRALMPANLRHQYYPAWQNVFVIAWTGMRGVVTLALALALPEYLRDGVTPFPHRDLIIFLGTSMIIFTLVIQGLSLPWLTRTLTLSFDHKRKKEEWHARRACAEQAVARLDELEAKGDANVHLPALVRIRDHLKERIESLGDGPHSPLNPGREVSLKNHPLLQAENRIWAEVLRRERMTVINMRRAYTIGDDVMNDLLREMDLLASRFHYEEQLLPESIEQAALNAEHQNSIWYQPKLRKLLGF